MIKDITKEEFEQKVKDKEFIIFPELEFTIREDKDEINMHYLYMRTKVKIDDYIVSLKMEYTYKDNLNYVALMQFVDSIQTNVTRYKKYFSPGTFLMGR